MPPSEARPFSPNSRPPPNSTIIPSPSPREPTFSKSSTSLLLPGSFFLLSISSPPPPPSLLVISTKSPFLMDSHPCRNLNIVYFIDGEEAERDWEVVEGFLQEDIQIRAGGRIKQMEEAIQIEKLFNDFFANVRTIIRLQSGGCSLKWGAEERKLSDLYQKVKEDIHQSLTDSFNTPKSIELLQQLVRSTNTYIKEQSFSIKKHLLNSIAEYVTSILQVFGFSSLHDATQTTGFQWDGSHPAVTEKILGELLNEFCKSRDTIRAAARQKLPADEIRKLCANPFSNHSLPDTIYQQVFK